MDLLLLSKRGHEIKDHVVHHDRVDSFTDGFIIKLEDGFVLGFIADVLQSELFEDCLEFISAEGGDVFVFEKGLSEIIFSH